MSRVFDLSEGKFIAIYSVPPAEAVMCAHAQSLGDLNTWDYDEKYSHLVEEGKGVFACGNFSCMKQDGPVARTAEQPSPSTSPKSGGSTSSSSTAAKAPKPSGETSIKPGNEESGRLFSEAHLLRLPVDVSVSAKDGSACIVDSDWPALHHRKRARSSSV
jgi:hypothetical protein